MKKTFSFREFPTLALAKPVSERCAGVPFSSMKWNFECAGIRRVYLQLHLASRCNSSDTAFTVTRASTRRRSATGALSERMDRERAEHDGGDQREGAVECKGLNPHRRTARQGTGVDMQAGFRRQFRRSRFPTI